MTSFRRHAIYWAPPAGTPLARFGAAWLGWDPAGGCAVPHPEVPGLPLPLAEITRTPGRYGFHGTLKPPFRLARGTTAADLHEATAALAARIGVFEAPPLALARLGRFVALVPSGPCTALSALAARAVAELDRFRAPPEDAELARRRAVGLTARQEEMLALWGYPFVMEESRFHLTLTGALPAGAGDAVHDALIPLTRPFRAAPLPVHEVCLFGEDDARLFHLIHRYALSG